MAVLDAYHIVRFLICGSLQVILIVYNIVCCCYIPCDDNPIEVSTVVNVVSVVVLP